MYRDTYRIVSMIIQMIHVPISLVGRSTSKHGRVHLPHMVFDTFWIIKNSVTLNRWCNHFKVTHILKIGSVPNKLSLEKSTNYFNTI